MLNKLIFFICLSISLSINSQSVDSENPIIVWEEIPNASGYQLQIRDEEDKLILEKDLQETSYKLDFDPGKYSHRVGAYNKFNKISTYSEWYSFVISRSVAPIVTSERQVISSKEEKEKKIIIKGKYFYKNTWLSLKNGNETLPVTSMKLNRETYELTIGNDYANAGQYDLILENPRKKILVIKNFYILKPASFFSSQVDSSYPYWKEALRSSVLPGWGQFRKEQKYKALFLDLSLILSMGYYGSSLNSFHSDKKKYNQAVSNSINYQLINGEENIRLYGFIEAERKFSQAEVASVNVYNASILVGSLYLLNILDALLWKHSVKISQNSRINFYANLRTLPITNISSTSNSSQIEFGLRFSF